MDVSSEFEFLFQQAKLYKQEHIFKYFNELDLEEKKKLLNHVKKIDFKQFHEIIKARDERKLIEMKDIHDLRPYPEEKISGSSYECDSSLKEKWWSLGLSSISRGEVCTIVLAGGQGTRLGVNYPKGMFDVNLPSHKTLFHIQAERILKLEELALKEYGKTKAITWYIMTSDATENETRLFFQKQNYFGLSDKNVFFFEQNNLPCVTFDGKIIMNTKSSISYSPNGNGGLYEVVNSKGILNNMKDRGIKYIHIYCVDNILVRICDPYFIGYCIYNKYDCCAKVVMKRNSQENVGVICIKNGKYDVIEYSEMKDEIKNLIDPNTGKLVYINGNICNHFLTYEGLDRISNFYLNDLKFHAAAKKITYYNDESGEETQPDKINGIKFERFIFDIFPFFNDFGIYRVKREEEFSPLKNNLNESVDNPETCKKDLMKYHTKLISKYAILSHPESQCSIEISPKITYAGEGLECFKGKFINNSSDVVIDSLV